MPASRPPTPADAGRPLPSARTSLAADGAWRASTPAREHRCTAVAPPADPRRREAAPAVPHRASTSAARPIARPLDRDRRRRRDGHASEPGAVRARHGRDRPGPRRSSSTTAACADRACPSLRGERGARPGRPGRADGRRLRRDRRRAPLGRRARLTPVRPWSARRASPSAAASPGADASPRADRRADADARPDRGRADARSAPSAATPAERARPRDLQGQAAATRWAGSPASSGRRWQVAQELNGIDDPSAAARRPGPRAALSRALSAGSRGRTTSRSRRP